MKENVIGLASLVFLIALLFLFIFYIFANNSIWLYFPFVCVAWCAMAMYIWNEKSSLINSKEWFLGALFSILWAIFWALTAGVELYLITGSVKGDINFSVFISIMIALAGCPLVTFIALAGGVRALSIKQNL